MKKPALAASVIVVFILGISIGLFIHTLHASKEPTSPQDIYTIAQKKAEDKCKDSGGTDTECTNLRTSSIQDVSCVNLAPQNGGKDRCGYWIFVFTNSTTYTPLRIIEVRVRYDKSILNVLLEVK